VPKATVASICNGTRPGGTRSASWLPKTKNRPASTGASSRRTLATQSISGSSDRAKGFAPKAVARTSRSTASGGSRK
jgi:hypothetical protein